jgi:hypothetical protein
MIDVVEIDDDDELYRRIVHYFVLDDGRISSSAFKDRRGKPDRSISVDLARLTTPEACLARAPNPSFQLGVLVAGGPRSLGFEVRHDPLPDNAAHALIEGQNTPEKCRRLAEMTRLVPITQDNQSQPG